MSVVVARNLWCQNGIKGQKRLGTTALTAAGMSASTLRWLQACFYVGTYKMLPTWRNTQTKKHWKYMAIDTCKGLCITTHVFLFVIFNARIKWRKFKWAKVKYNRDPLRTSFDFLWCPHDYTLEKSTKCAKPLNTETVSQIDILH